MHKAATVYVTRFVLLFTMTLGESGIHYFWGLDNYTML